MTTRTAAPLEAREHERTTARLHEAHPAVHPDRVRDVVDAEHAAFEGCRLRTDVPILAERAAREVLRGAAAHRPARTPAP